MQSDPRKLSQQLTGIKKRKAEGPLNEENQRRREKRDAHETQELIAVLNTIEGRRVLLRILNRCGMFRKGFVSDPNQSYFHAGEREIGLWLQDLIDGVDPNYFLAVLKEKRAINAELKMQQTPALF